MKILYLVRHAKSSWGDFGADDHERTLNDRGRRDAPRMGKEMLRHNVQPDKIISSSAVRALATTEMIAAELSYDQSDIIVNENVYGAEADELIELVQGLDDELDKVMLIGHNPTVTDLVNRLARCVIDNVPTCGFAVIGFQVGRWSDTGEGVGSLLEFGFPKKLTE